MIIKDRYEVPWIVTDKTDIAKVDACIELILGMKENIIFNIDYEKDSDSFCLSLLHIFCAELFLSMEKNKYNKACEILKISSTLLRHESDSRSIAINDALLVLKEGNYILARNYFYRLLSLYPKDIFIFYVTHMIEFNNGMTPYMLETLQLVRPHWEKHDTFYGYCKGIESFILHENGLYEESRQCGEEAIALNPNDIYAIHALCHHYYDRQAYYEGKLFMDNLASNWQINYGMRLHLYWHYALFLLKLDEYHLLPNIYRLLRDKNNSQGLEDLDATSLLFRLSLTDNLCFFHEEVYELFKSWCHAEELGFYFFNDFHAALIFSLSDRVDLIDYLISQSINSRPTDYYEAKVVLLQAIKYHTKSEYGEVIRCLSQPLDFSFMGGSKAQRSVITEILAYATKKVEELYDA